MYYQETKSLENIIKSNNYTNVLLFTGKNSYSLSGSKKYIEDSLLGCNITRIFDFSVNPKAEEAEKILNNLVLTKFDCIIAIGGGSVIDFAKLINFFGSKNIKIADYLLDKTNKVPETSLLPFIAIPTTAGTGSEATHFSVVYLEGNKYSVASSEILPNSVILEPSLTEQLPKYQTACVSLDAMAQAIESLWAVNATKESIKYAQKALKLIIPNIENVVNNPNSKNRADMLLGSYYAGKAINISKTTGPHAFSYYFTSKYNMPHGDAVSLTLVRFLELNWPNIDSDIQTKFLKSFGVNRFEDLKNNLVSIIQKVGLGVYPKIDNFEKFVQDLKENVNVERLSNNPAEVVVEDVIKNVKRFFKVK